MSLINRSLGAIGAFLRAGPDTSHVASEVQGSTASPHSGDSASEEIPVLHRLAIIYLMLPVLIWLVGWFEWWFGVPAAVLMALGLWQALRPARASHKWQVFSGALRSALRPTTVVLLLIALAWVMTTAAGGVFDVHNPDWHKHRSILLDLGRGDWPTEPVASLRDHLNVPILMRHYLGYYMVPGLIRQVAWAGGAELGRSALDVVRSKPHLANVHPRVSWLESDRCGDGAHLL